MKVEANIELIEGGSVKISFIVPPSGLKSLFDNLKGNKKVKVVKEAPDLKTKRLALRALIVAFKDAHPDLHPSPMYMKFYEYWGEASPDGKKIRYEGQKFFSMGKRLATFRGLIKPDELDKMWGEHNKLKANQGQGTLTLS